MKESRFETVFRGGNEFFRRECRLLWNKCNRMLCALIAGTAFFSMPQAIAAKSETVDDSFGDVEGLATQNKPMVTVGLCQQAPRVDGRCTAEEWENSVLFTGFIDNFSRLYAAPQFHVALQYDKEKLYVAFISQSDNSDDWSAISLQAPRQAEPWEVKFCDDGRILDRQGRPFPPDAVECRVNNTGKESQIELAIPFKTLGVRTPGERESWKVNFCRFSQRRNSHVSWAAERVPSVDPASAVLSSWGTLIFDNRAPVIRIKSFGNLEESRRDVQAAYRSGPGEGGQVFLFLDFEKDMSMTRFVKTGRPNKDKFVEIDSRSTAPGVGTGLVCDYVTYSFLNRGFRRCYYRSERLPQGRLAAVNLDAPSIEGKKRIAITADLTGITPDRLGKSRMKVTLKNKGELVDEVVTANLNPKRVRITFQPAKLHFGGSYDIQASILDAGNVERAQARKSLTMPNPAEWLDNSYGISNRVPAPFTPLCTKNSTVLCWGREYSFERGCGFPSQVSAQGAAILSEPVRLQMRVQGKELNFANPEGAFRKTSETSVVYQSSESTGALRVESKTTVEYDGMIRIDFTLIPRGPVVLDALRLLIPLKAEYAKYLGSTMSRGAGSGSYGALPERGWKSEFLPFVWLGDEDRGLLWFCESDRNWQLKEPGKALEVNRQGGTVLLQVNMADSHYRLEAPVSFTMGLQASPVRPRPEGWRSWRNLTVFPTSINYFGDPVAALEKYTLQLEKLKKEGVPVILYTFFNNVSTACPEYNYFYKDWSRGDGEKSKYYLAITCPAVKSWQDYNIWRNHLAFKNEAVEGLQYDLGWPAPCSNTEHGCGFHGYDGKLHCTWPVFGAREIVQRNYTMLREKKSSTRMAGHFSGNAIILPIAAFCDIIDQGEQFSPPKHRYREQCSLERMRTEFTLRQFGPVSWFLPQIAKSSDSSYTAAAVAPTMEMLSLLYPHDVLIWNLWGNSAAIKRHEDVFSAFFRKNDARFLPYWNNRKFIGCDSKQIIASAYSRPGECLLVVSNPSDTAETATILLNCAELSLPDKDLTAVDAVSGEALPMNGAKLQIFVKKWWVRLIVIKHGRPDKETASAHNATHLNHLRGNRSTGQTSGLSRFSASHAVCALRRETFDFQAVLL